MISLLVVSSIAALIAVKEWKKTEYLELESNTNKVDSDSSNVVNDVDLKSLMEQIGDNRVVIPEDFNPDAWIDAQGHKLRVLAGEDNVQFRLHLPNYIKRGVPKVRHYVTAMREWRQSHGYMPDEDRVELQVTYVDPEKNTHVLIVPEVITKDFADERDRSGANRMYEALVIDKHESHNKALSALHGIINSQNEIKALEVVICYEYSGLNNNAIANILSCPIEVENEAGEIVKTENVLFSSDLESFYEMDDEKEEVVEYVFSFD